MWPPRWPYQTPTPYLMVFILQLSYFLCFNLFLSSETQTGSWSSVISVFLKDIYYHRKSRFTETRRKRGKDLPSAGSVPKWPQWPKLSRYKARSQEFLPVFQWGYRVPMLWAILYCFCRPQAGSWVGNRASRT